MKYKAVIFDMDGTIIDTTDAWFNATKTLIERRGVLYTDEVHNELAPLIHGRGTLKSCIAINDVLQLQENPHHLASEKTEIALGLFKQGIAFIKGFKEFHQIVQNLFLKNAVATNADDQTIQHAEEALQLSKFFDKHIYGIESVNNIGKPNPAIYLHAAKQIGVKPEECIAIEDSRFGVKAAQDAGMLCIGINTSNDVQDTKDANIKINSYQEIDLNTLLYDEHTKK